MVKTIYVRGPTLARLAMVLILCFKPAVNRQPGFRRWDSSSYTFQAMHSSEVQFNHTCFNKFNGWLKIDDDYEENDDGDDDDADEKDEDDDNNSDDDDDDGDGDHEDDDDCDDGRDDDDDDENGDHIIIMMVMMIVMTTMK